MRSDRGSAILGLSILFFAVMAFAAYYKDNGIHDISRLRSDITAIHQESDRLRLANANMRRELGALAADSFYVEAIARKSLGLVKPGEVVYEFVDSKSLRQPLGED